jgi:glycosyltransferase involved in cell wall biosynthesis
MPVRNGGSYLRTALESIAMQDSGDVEVIVEGGSTDGTLAVVDEYSGRLPLTLVRTEGPGNWVAKTNIGIARARGTFVSFLHHDDAWAPDRIRVLRRVAAERPEARWLVHDARYIDAHGFDVGRWTCPLSFSLGYYPPSVLFPRLAVQNFFPINAPLVRREALLEAGPLDERYPYTADWHLWLRLAARHGVLHVSEVLSDFRIHAGSMTLREASDLEAFNRQFRGVLDEYLPALADHAADPLRWRRLAEFSQLANVTLAALATGRPSSLGRLVLETARLGPANLLDYLRFSRILPRAVSRIRAACPPVPDRQRRSERDGVGPEPVPVPSPSSGAC